MATKRQQAKARRTRAPHLWQRPPAGCVLTPRQAECLAAIDAALWRDQRAPTLRELALALGTAADLPQGPNVSLQALIRKGFLERDRFGCIRPGARTLRIVKRRDGDRVLIRGAWYEFVPADRLGEGVRHAD